MAATTPRSPACRRAATAMPRTDTTLTIATPMARPVSPPSFTGSARASNSSGPGLFMSSPTVSDAEVHVPSSG
jgi:hypothetical protein